MSESTALKLLRYCDSPVAEREFVDFSDRRTNEQAAVDLCAHRQRLERELEDTRHAIRWLFALRAPA